MALTKPTKPWCRNILQQPLQVPLHSSPFEEHAVNLRAGFMPESRLNWAVLIMALSCNGLRRPLPSMTQASHASPWLCRHWIRKSNAGHVCTVLSWSGLLTLTPGTLGTSGLWACGSLFGAHNQYEDSPPSIAGFSEGSFYTAPQVAGDYTLVHTLGRSPSTPSWTFFDLGPNRMSLCAQICSTSSSSSPSITTGGGGGCRLPPPLYGFSKDTWNTS